MSITKPLSFCSVVSLCLFAFVPDSHAAQPYQDIWNCVHTRLGWTVQGRWEHNVKGTGSAFYIGSVSSRTLFINSLRWSCSALVSVTLGLTPFLSSVQEGRVEGPGGVGGRGGVGDGVRAMGGYPYS